MKVKKVLLTTAALTLGLVATSLTSQGITQTAYAFESGWQGNNFFKADGTQAKDEWVEYNGHWYFITPNSVYAHDTWKGEYYLKQ
ncbi:hypothetical protein SAMN05421767_1311, partial [Granulicatella balaenopterae]